MKKEIVSVVIFLLMLSPVVCKAEGAGLNYNYFEANLVNVEFDETDNTALAGRAIISYDVSSNVRVAAAYGYGEADTNTFISSEFALFGAGYHMPLNDRVDAVFDAGMAFSWITIGDNADSDNGLFLQAKLRFAATDKLEMDAIIRHTDTFDGSTDLALNAIFKANDRISLGVLLELIDDPASSNIGLLARFSF